MKSMTILGAFVNHYPASTDEVLPGLFAEGAARPSRSVLRWKVAVQGFGRDRYYPTLRNTVRVLQFDANSAEELRRLVEHASCEDAASYRAGD